MVRVKFPVVPVCADTCEKTRPVSLGLSLRMSQVEPSGASRDSEMGAESPGTWSWEASAGNQRLRCSCRWSRTSHRRKARRRSHSATHRSHHRSRCKPRASTLPQSRRGQRRTMGSPSHARRCSAPGRPCPCRPGPAGMSTRNHSGIAAESRSQAKASSRLHPHPPAPYPPAVPGLPAHAPW